MGDSMFHVVSSFLSVNIVTGWVLTAVQQCLDMWLLCYLWICYYFTQKTTWIFISQYATIVRGSQKEMPHIIYPWTFLIISY